MNEQQLNVGFVAVQRRFNSLTKTSSVCFKYLSWMGEKSEETKGSREQRLAYC